MYNNRILGCLYGQVIGDSLGARYEFQKSANVCAQINFDMKDNFLPILGGGIWKVEAGQCTDDTELAFGLAHGIIKGNGYNKEIVVNKYLKWFQSRPFDIGNTTKRAFFNSKCYDDIVKKNDINSLSNGCLMRISPLAIYGTTINDEILLNYCKTDCEMTNPNPITVNAVQVYIMAIKYAILTGDRNKSFIMAVKYAREPLIKEILNRAKNNEKRYILSDGKILESADKMCTGYFGIALQMAFRELLHGKSFYQSLINTITKGGDTDTNGCIVGALVGALYGEIPKDWTNAVRINNPRMQEYAEIDQKNIDKIAIKLTMLNKY